jgi:alkylhydroperoxidase family enzyme
MKLIARIADWLGSSAVPPRAGGHALVGYLALGRRPGFGGTLEPRTMLLATALAAELSGCRWCIDRAHHDWRIAGLPAHLLDQLRAHAGSQLFTSRERAALGLVEAVACARASPSEIEHAREVLTDNELAELTAVVAEHHFLEAIDSNLPAP